VNKIKPTGPVRIDEHSNKLPAPSPAGEWNSVALPIGTTIDIDRHFRALGIDEIRLFRAELMTVLAQIMLLGERVEEAFAARPLRRDILPNAPENQQRFDAYVKSISMRIRLMRQVHEILNDLDDLEAKEAAPASKAGKGDTA